MNTAAIIESLRAHIAECDDGEGIPGWCIATGKCTCQIAQKALQRIERIQAKRKAPLPPSDAMRRRITALEAELRIARLEQEQR